MIDKINTPVLLNQQKACGKKSQARWQVSKLAKSVYLPQFPGNSIFRALYRQVLVKDHCPEIVGWFSCMIDLSWLRMPVSGGLFQVEVKD